MNAERKMEKQEKKASILWYIQDALFTISLLIANGTIFQGFMLDQGFSNGQVGIYSMLVNITQASVMLFSSGLVDRIASIKKAFCFSVCGQAPLYGLLLLLSWQKQMDANAMFILYMALISVLNLLIGFRTIIYYKIPFTFLRKEVYGQFSIVVAIIGALFGAISSYISSIVLERVSYQLAMPVAFCVSIVLVVASGIISFSIRQTNQHEESSSAEKKLSFGVLKKRITYSYILPNLARGLSTGIIGMIAVFAIVDIGAETVFVGRIAFITQLAYVLAYSTYLLFYKYTTAKAVTLIGSVFYSVTLILLAVVKNELAYLLLLGVCNFGVGLYSIGIPIVIAENVSYDIIGGYTSWRLLITTAGIAAGSAVGGLIAGRVPSLLIFTAAAMLQIICGAAYFRFPNETQ